MVDTAVAATDPMVGSASAAERGDRLLEALSGEAVRRQEVPLILLNLAVLAGIALVHALFAPSLGAPARLFFVVLAARFLMQTVELTWLSAGRPAAAVLHVYAHVAIWVNVVFAFALSRLGGMEDSHYVVLMVIPVVAAAFRYRPAGVALVLAAAVALTFLEIWLYFRGRPVVNAIEYFEAANVVLVYLVVAAVVTLLVRQLRRESRALSASLAELQRTRDRLVEEKSLAAVGRLASSIAHEIRNPVGMIVSSVALLRDGGMDRDEACSIVHAEAGRLERLTTDFLSYARQRPPEREPVDVATALGYVAELARARLAEHGLVLQVRCPQGLVADGDPFQLHQALLNLVINAAEASPAGAEIVLEAAAADGGVLLAVENPGDPLAPEVAARVFEPFFTTRPAGTGLGLAITRSIAERHGGWVRLEVNEPGRVRFSMRIPGTGGEA